MSDQMDLDTIGQLSEEIEAMKDERHEASLMLNKAERKTKAWEEAAMCYRHMVIEMMGFPGVQSNQGPINRHVLSMEPEAFMATFLEKPK